MSLLRLYYRTKKKRLLQKGTKISFTYDQNSFSLGKGDDNRLNGISNYSRGINSVPKAKRERERRSKRRKKSDNMVSKGFG